MTDMLDGASALRVAERAARRAGDALVERQRDMMSGKRPLQARTKRDAIDYVSIADAEAQAIILDEISQAYPLHRILAEEEGADDRGDPDSPYCWIIDPLDGTTPFLHGKPNFGVIIALQHNEETVLGLIWRPFFDEMHTALRGKGAYINGIPAALRDTHGMTDAVLAANLMHRAKQDPDGTYRVSTPYCASIENYGNAAQEFAEILLGRNDGLFFDGPRMWDAAAGCLLVQEAGGAARLERKHAEDARGPVLCVASTQAIFEPLCRFVFEEKRT